MNDPLCDALRAVLAWLTALWAAGQAPDGADAIADLVAAALSVAEAGDAPDG